MTSTRRLHDGYVVSSLPETPPKDGFFSGLAPQGSGLYMSGDYKYSKPYLWPRDGGGGLSYGATGIPAVPRVPSSDDIPGFGTASDKSDERSDYLYSDSLDDFDDDDIQFLGQRPAGSQPARQGRQNKVTKGVLAPQPPLRRSARTAQRVQAATQAQVAQAQIDAAEAAHAASLGAHGMRGILGSHGLAAPGAMLHPFASEFVAQDMRVAKPREILLRQVPDIRPSALAVDDNDGFYLVNKGADFADRYIIVKLLGQGTFGKVVEAIDRLTQQHVAIKIIRAVPKYRDASKIELRVLSMLSHCDPMNNARCVHMRECFDYRNHVCLVTELLDISVYDFLKDNQFVPFPAEHILAFARQLLYSVAFIHGLGLVHTDLKPENILLSDAACSFETYKRTPKSTPRQRKVLHDPRITLIDFGSAIFDDEYHSSVVSTRHYRAPEIILGTGWSFPCDMWSIGCVLIELCTGNVLFQTRDNLEHLNMMERCLGQSFSQDIIMRASRKQDGAPLVDLAGSCVRPVTDAKQLAAVNKMQSLSQLVRSSVPYSRERRFWDNFLDFVHKLLSLDPAQRPAARDALSHPWIMGQ